MLGGRSPAFVVRQLAEPDNYRALWRMPWIVLRPRDFAGRYFLGRGRYPARIRVRTPAGLVDPLVYSHHDVFTVNEIFCRGDYRLPADARTVVDVGSNIGISALYFLTHAPRVRCHLFEPDPRNVARLRDNLAAFGGRIELTEAAVADFAGRSAFGREPTGRYGGLRSDLPEQIEVDCVHIDDVLAAVLERAGSIDMLKIDSEGMENRTLMAADPQMLARVRLICLDTRVPVNPAPARFALHFATDTARLTNRGPVSRGAPDLDR